LERVRPIEGRKEEIEGPCPRNTDRSGETEIRGESGGVKTIRGRQPKGGVCPRKGTGKRTMAKEHEAIATRIHLGNHPGGERANGKKEKPDSKEGWGRWPKKKGLRGMPASQTRK